MKNLILLALLTAILCLNPIGAQAAYQVTYAEFDILDDLLITVSTTTAKVVLECRAELDKRPIGSGSAIVEAGVALVRISIPAGLRARSAEFTYVCIE